MGVLLQLETLEDKAGGGGWGGVLVVKRLRKLPRVSSKRKCLWVPMIQFQYLLE